MGDGDGDEADGHKEGKGEGGKGDGNGDEGGRQQRGNGDGSKSNDNGDNGGGGSRAMAVATKRVMVMVIGAAVENFLSKKCFQMVFFVSAML